MTDLEISKALALAIGWDESKFYVNPYGNLQIDPGPDAAKYPMWRMFDYRKWNLIGPIAEKLIVELVRCESTIDGRRVIFWEAIHGMKEDADHCIATGDTPQKAIALAVIGGAKK